MEIQSSFTHSFITTSNDMKKFLRFVHIYSSKRATPLYYTNHHHHATLPNIIQIDFRYSLPLSLYIHIYIYIYTLNSYTAFLVTCNPRHKMIYDICIASFYILCTQITRRNVIRN